MLAADGEPDRLRRRRHGDAARTSSRCSSTRSPTTTVALGSRIQPDGSDMRASQPRVPPAARQGLPRSWPRSGSSARSRTRSAGSRVSRARRPRPVRAAADHEHRVRRRAHLPRPAAGLLAGDRPDPLVRPARLADARPAGARPAGRLGPVPDPAHPPRRAAGSSAEPRDGADRYESAGASGPADRRDPRVRRRRRSDARRRRRHARLRLPRVPPGGDPRPATAERLYDLGFESSGGFGLFYYPPTFVPLILPFGLLPSTTAVWVWTGLLIAAFLVGVAVLPVSATVRWWIVLLAGLSWPFVYAVKLGQVGPILFLRSSRSAGAGWTTRSASALSGALGTAIKLQPGLVLVWALLTGAVSRGRLRRGRPRRPRRRRDAPRRARAPGPTSSTLVRQVSDPITTPHNFTPGAIAYQLGLAPTASIVQLVSTVLALVAVVVGDPAGDGRGLVPGRGRSRASSSRRSSGTITRCCCSCRSPTCWRPVAGGRWRSRSRRPFRSSASRRAIVYPIVVLGDAPRGPRGRDPRAARRRRARWVTRRVDREAIVGLLRSSPVSAVIYWLANREFDAGRGDFFYLADAFLHGRTWLTFQPRPVRRDPRRRSLLRAVRAVPGGRAHAARRARRAGHGRPVGVRGQRAPGRRPASGCAGGSSAGSASARLRTGSGSTILFGFSTQILWVTTRGGVWHTGHLIATILTFACLIELWGRQRAWLIGLLAGAAFLTRAPLAFAIPFYALLLIEARRRGRPDVPGSTSRAARTIPWRSWVWLAVGVLPAIVFVLRLQPGPLRDTARVGLRARDAARRSSRPARPGACSRSPTSR